MSSNKPWEERYQELMEFHAEHGHFTPSMKDKTYQKLGLWVVRQRQLKKKGALPREHMKRLDRIGFPWEANPFDIEWLATFLQLKSFHQHYGHSTPEWIPPQDKSTVAKYKKLMEWTKTQRASKDSMPTDRTERLDSIDFQWRLNKLELNWERRLYLYKQHRQAKQAGETTQEELPSDMLRWVGKQRHGKRSGEMPFTRQAKLDAAGFEWEPTVHDNRWNEKLERLKQYKKEHGDVHVKLRYKDHSLAVWVHNQRLCYRRNRLSQDRIDKLEALGFVWWMRSHHQQLVASSGGSKRNRGKSTWTSRDEEDSDDWQEDSSSSEEEEEDDSEEDSCSSFQKPKRKRPATTKRTKTTTKKKNKTTTSAKQGHSTKGRHDGDETSTTLDVSLSDFDSHVASIPSATKKRKTTKQAPRQESSPLPSELEKIRKGSRVAVLWPDDDEYYEGVVTKTRNFKNNVYVEYDDGEQEWVDLSKQTVRVLSKWCNDASEAQKKKNAQAAQLQLGSRISIWWPAEKEFFEATVCKIDPQRRSNRPHYVEYDDGDSEWINLFFRNFIVMGSADDLEINSRIKVWWDAENEFYTGTVKKILKSEHTEILRPHFIEYDDGDSEWTNLSLRLFQPASTDDEE